MGFCHVSLIPRAQKSGTGQFSAPTLLAPSITLPFRLLFSLLWTFNSCILDSCHQSPTQSMAPILWQRTIFNSTKVIHSVSPLGNVSKGQKHLWACNKRETITTTTHGYLGCTWMVTKAGVAQESLHPLRNENGDPALHPLWQQPLERHRDNPFTSPPSLSPPTQEKNCRSSLWLTAWSRENFKLFTMKQCLWVAEDPRVVCSKPPVAGWWRRQVCQELRSHLFDFSMWPFPCCTVDIIHYQYFSDGFPSADCSDNQWT